MTTPPLPRLFLMLAAVCACSGAIVGEGTPAPNSPDGSKPRTPGSSTGDGWGGGPTPPTGEATKPPVTACLPDPGPAFLRRLTNVEYQNTVRDLLGETEEVTAAFPPDNQVFGFDNNAESVGVSPLHAGQYRLAAQRLATSALGSRRAQVLGCDPAVNRQACLSGFIDRFGRRAYRRQLTADERQALLTLAESAAADPDPSMGARLVIQAVLQSPSFLFRPEVGVSDSRRPGLARLTGYEVATRLSFLLFRTTPDDALLDAAGRGELDTPAGIEARLGTMLKDPRAREGLRAFYSQWLRTSSLDDVSRDPARYPGWSDTLLGSLREETHRLMEPLVSTPDGDFLSFLTTREVWVDAALAKLYGVAAPAKPQTWAKATLDGTKRAGFLTLGAALIPTANGSAIAMPIHRGAWVREVLLCEEPPPPPANVPDLPETAGANVSDRERLEAHSRSPACAGCHALMDPIGFGLSNFDAVGAYRTTDSAGRPIDARGTVAGMANGDFSGGVELGQKLGASPAVARCAVQSLFRYTQARDTTAADQCTVDGLLALFNASGNRLQSTLIAFAKSDAFRYRALAEKGATP